LEIGLYEATLEPGHLDFAIELAEAMLANFYGAEPGGNSVAALALLKPGGITGREDFTHAAENTLRLFARRLEHFPQAMPFKLHTVDFWLDEPRRAVIAWKNDSTEFQKLLQAAHPVYQPGRKRRMKRA